MLERLGINAKEAEKTLMVASSEKKNQALKKIAEGLIENTDKIIEANKVDLENGEKNGMAKSMLDRLKLDKERIEGMAKGVLDVATLPEPVGRILSATERPNGLRIEKVSTPIGVIAVIFEARPNVTSDAAALCLKSGNTVILRGGKEAINSNKTIAKVMRQAVKEAGMPEDVIQLVEDTSRESANELMKMNEYVDVLIPRGGAGLIQAVVKNATVPVIETGVGNCHIYIDKNADLKKAVDIVFNAKTSRPSVCNAAESLLIHKDIAKEALVAIKNKLDEKDVTLVGDSKAREIIPDMEKATDADWATEYLDYKMSVKIVDSVEEAIDHIYKYSTGHSECIVTENARTAEKFMDQVDSAAVYLNASTRFTDGGEFGFGAEIGISTQKLHARGPIGLPELQSFKYKIYGNGQIRK
ncbi:glutamate-5-semialdehyde dehydrogenase [uncultured Eubacterium sp.]|uniref:glutamate-5-semialdehyde dehydrogenase n=1 Tax=uncultured Eubacterium sp. TaxID=165185 RepID=UPI0025953FB2|nr:glutamate-5-semialdehyde dehydrogenase [uncultured Eubacterium sp.]